MLTENQKEQIHYTALKILKDVGVNFHNNAALKIFEKAGAVVDYQSKNVRISEDLVQYAIDQTPSEFSMFDREMGKQYLWGDSELKIGTGGSVINLLDSDGITIRPPKTIDLIKMYKLTDVLPEVSWTAPGSFVSDIPKEIAAIWRFYLRLKYGSKPSCADGIDLNDLSDNCELMEIVRSNSSDYAKKPFAIAQPCPQSPLSWSPEGVGCLFECARRNIPALILSMPFAGVSAPFTMAGLISQQCAEILSGLILLQLKQPGLPVVYGGGASHADMRDISNVMGSIYAQMMNAATIRMANYYNLPSGTAAIFGYSDSKMNDYQAGAETALSQFILFMSEPNIVYGLGIMAGMDCNSLEKIVMDHEVFISIKEFAKGIPVSEASMAFDNINDVGPEGNFLSSQFTLDRFKDEYNLLKIFNHKSKETWENKGKMTCQKAANEYLLHLLENTSLNRLAPKQDRELDTMMAKILKRRGFQLDKYLHLLPE